MNARLYEITCSDCHSKWMVKVESVVNANIEVPMKAMLLNASFFKRKCSCCGKIIHFYYPFLYCDTTNKSLVILCTKEEEQWIKQLKTMDYYQDYICYEVENENQLKESILIIDFQLSANKLNTFKQSVSNQYNNVYIDMIHDGYIFFNSDEKEFAIEMKYVKED